MTFVQTVSRSARRSLACSLSVVALTACSRDAGTPELPATTPVILISIDTLRSDRLPAYGYGGVETPAIDRLRADGILFERAYSPVPLTLPAHASMMTGLLPPDHGVRDNIGYELSTGVPTLASLFAELGYRTGAVVSGIVLRRATGMDRGFEHYEDAFDTDRLAVLGEIQRSGLESIEAILPWLQEQLGNPWFLFVHLYDPHTPYDPPEPFAGQVDSPYDGEIAAADAAVGRLLTRLDELGLYQSTIILLTSDHGEGLFDHGEAEHGVFLYRESLQVPLILKLPDARRAGTAVAVPVQITDIAPTLLSLVGHPIPDSMSGRSLLDLAEGAHDRSIYAESFYPQLRLGWSALRSIIHTRYHYIEAPHPELYDLVDDPAEQVNILNDYRPIYGAMRQLLDAYPATLEPPHEADPEVREALLSLGYLSSSVTGQPNDRLPDPKDRIHTLASLDEGMRALRAGDPGTAVPLLKQAVSDNPKLVVGWQFLGLALIEQALPEDAYSALSEAFRLSHGSPGLARSLASVALATGRTDESEKYLSLAIDHDPSDLRLQLLRGRVLIELGRSSEALAAAEAVRLSEPNNADATYLAGAARIGIGQPIEAEADLREALRLAPDHTAAMSDLAVLLISQGRYREARPLVERIQQLRPGDRLAGKLMQQIEEG